MGANVRLIDARGLLPPEPFELTLAALEDLEPGGELILLLYREPHPLYQVLRQNGFAYRAESLDDGTFEIHITHAG
jgi:uncharacterized protein (DUF2249 family)